MGKALDGRVHLVEVGEGSGRIWSKAPCVQESGLMSILRPIAAKSPFQDVRFTIQGDKFVLADRRGNLYAFHVLQNRYNLVIRSGSTPTALAFSPSPKTYCVIASKDKVIRVVDIEVATVVATLKGHRTPVTEVSFHPLGQYMVSTSSDRVVVWDTRSWNRRRTLDTHDICQALFSPTGASILTCVGSEGIVAWDSLKFRMQYRLSPPKPGSVSSTDLQRFAVSSDGRYVIGAGNSPNLFLWEANIVTLLRIAVMPVSVTSVRQVAFLPDSDVAIVLGDDGSLLMYNVISLRVLISIAEPHKLVTSFAIGSGGRYAACTMSDGTVGLYDLDCAFSAEEQRAKRRLEQGTPKEEVRRFLGSQKVFGSEQVRPAPSQPARSLAATDSDVPSSSNADVDGMDPARDRDQDDAASDAERSLSRSSSSKLLQPHKLKSLLRAQGEYPERYRLLIWRFLLRIPENRDLYGALTQKGIHEAYVKLDERYPLKERRLFRRLQRVLSCLAHWSPLFSEVEYLPSMVFPFVRLFPADDAVVFEIVCTLLLNWCTRWFEFFPNPPMTLLQQIEALLKHHDGALLKHLVEQGIESSEYAWPILQTLFTEILGKQDWLVLLDHLLSNRPTLIVYLVVAYLKRQRAQIVQLHSRHNIAQFVHQQNPIELPAL